MSSIPLRRRTAGSKDSGPAVGTHAWTSNHGNGLWEGMQKTPNSRLRLLYPTTSHRAPLDYAAHRAHNRRFSSLMTHPLVAELIVRAKSSSPSARPATVFPRPSQMWQLLETLKSSAGSVSAITSQREGPLLLHEASRATPPFASYHARSRTDRSRQRDRVRHPKPTHVGVGP